MLPAAPHGRVDRLDRLLRVLADRPGISAPDLAREFDVSARSIFRDVAALRHRGHPIEAPRGGVAGCGCTAAGGWARCSSRARRR